MKIYHYNGKCNACGQKIKALRKKAEITQGQLAARMQVQGVVLEQKNISRIERGERLVANYELWAFAQVFQVAMEDLMEGMAEE